MIVPRPTPYPATLEGIDAARLADIRRACKLSRYPLVLAGDTGTGKTCAARAVWSLWKRPRGKAEPEMWDSGELCRLLVSARMGRPGGIFRPGWFSLDATEVEIHRIVTTSALLVLDDILSDKPNGEELKALRSIINWRSLGELDADGREKFLPFIVTTNLKEAEIEAIDERIVSRVFRYPAIDFTGKDRRAKA